MGKMRRIIIDNVNVYNADSRYACIISGVPDHYIEDISLNNIRILYKGGYRKADGKIIPPENEKVYPEPWMFGTIPASSFFIRHARNIQFKNINIGFMRKDYRPAFVLNDTENIRMQDVVVDLPEGVEMKKEIK
jgi:hypothetical protein